MADTPLIPDEANVKNVTDYLNIQKQISDTLKKNLEISDKIGHIDRNMESNLKKNSDTQRQILIEIQKQNKELQMTLNQSGTILEENKKAFQAKVDSQKLEIKNNKDLILSMQEEMNLKMQAAEAQYDEEHKYHNLVTSLFPKVFGFQNKSLTKYKEIYDMLNKSTFKLKQFAGLFAAVLTLANHAFEVFQKFDKVAADFRISMGFTRKEALGLRSVAEKLAIDFGHVGVNIDGAYSAIRALSKEMGSAYLVTSEMVKNVALLKAQLGVSEEDSAGFMRNLASVSKSTMQIQSDMGYTAAAMSQASGVPLAQIMNDVGKASSLTLTMMSRVPNQILRSAIELRRMGSSLNEAAKSSREILNFSDNINAEMEASVLLGKSINLQRARELAYRRDLEGSTKEIVRITKNINFENLDVFQQEAYARATGKSVDELLRLVQVDRQWAAARRSTDPELKRMVANYDAMRNASKATVISETEKLKLMVQQKANQDRLTSISNKWNQILTQASAIFLPMIDLLLSAVIPAMDIAQSFFGIMVAARAIGTSMAWIGKGIAFFMNDISKVYSFFFRIVGIGTKIVEFVAEVGSKLGGIIKWALPFAGMFGDAIPVLGEVIMALQFIYGFFKGFSETSGGFGQKIWGGLKSGLMEIVGPLLDLLKWPFNKFLSWFGAGPLAGHSPSEIGLSILKGITSVGVMLYDALTSPFRHALAWIADKIPGMGKVAEKLRGGVQGLMNKPLEARAAAAYIPAVQVTPNGTRIASNPDAKPTSTNTEKDKDTTTLADVVSSIKALTDAITSGKVKAGDVYLDGSLLSSTLARSLSFHGNYGVNK